MIFALLIIVYVFQYFLLQQDFYVFTINKNEIGNHLENKYIDFRLNIGAVKKRSLKYI